jgi:hypothetical protein
VAQYIWHDRWLRFRTALDLPSRRSSPRIERLGDGSQPEGHGRAKASAQITPGLARPAAETCRMNAPAAAAIVALSRSVMTHCRGAGRGGKIEDAMPTDLTVILEHRPGELARLAEITGEAGVTIHGLAAFTGEGKGVVHVLLDNEAVAGCRAALERAGMGIADEREVFVIDVQDRPAALGELTRRLAEANVNVDLAYTTFTGGKIVIATDDVGSARAVLR